MDSESDLRRKAAKLEDTLHSFNIDAEVTNVTQGPTVTRYEVHPNVGVKVSGITNLANDIALNMEAASVSRRRSLVNLPWGSKSRTKRTAW